MHCLSNPAKGIGHPHKNVIRGTLFVLVAMGFTCCFVDTCIYYSRAWNWNPAKELTTNTKTGVSLCVGGHGHVRFGGTHTRIVLGNKPQILQGALMSFSNWHSETRAPCGAKSERRTYECLQHPVLNLPKTAVNLRPLGLLIFHTHPFTFSGLAWIPFALSRRILCVEPYPKWHTPAFWKK